MTTAMPFGKYKGVAVNDLPDDYLAWLVTRPNLWRELRIAVETVQHERAWLAVCRAAYWEGRLADHGQGRAS